ncbi:MAG: acetyl-CoA carboxylase biotin carboxylase subunit [Dehalococcoidia bacterium]|nr:acetyl-CoA carboxylase biotin carboxylase subunit [Dehalococcoidia bacterium]
MFNKILIANRGEIAVRIIRACRETGIRTVAVYSEADRNAMHVRFADEAFLIGPAPARESYLNVERILIVARQSGADAIHPGYGFLAENPSFADKCEAAGLTFIGPSSDAQRAMADKTAARRRMLEAGIPIVPGTTEPIASFAEAAEAAAGIGYPVIIKAAGGGGGKGMRIVASEAALADAVRMATSEVKAAFGESAVYIEKYVEPARHIEVQLLADNFGNVIHLGERECSVQRRYQKLIEESPSPALDDNLRHQITATAVRAAVAANYNNAGTAEFLLAPDGKFYFLEMNTRLQVEHPVTEFVTGVDIVKAQIHLAAGEKLRFTQEEIHPQGAAIECRIYAEDPYNMFLPSIGVIRAIQEPSGPGVRIESAAHYGMPITVYYDALIAKIITWGSTRHEAINRMRRALREYQIVGVKTTKPFHQFVMEDDTFCGGAYDTKYVQKVWGAQTQEVEDLSPVAALAATLVAHAGRATRHRAAAQRETDSPWKYFGRREMMRRT